VSITSPLGTRLVPVPPAMADDDGIPLPDGDFLTAVGHGRIVALCYRPSVLFQIS
jgi:hypothetical protein